MSTGQVRLVGGLDDSLLPARLELRSPLGLLVTQPSRSPHRLVYLAHVILLPIGERVADVVLGVDAVLGDLPARGGALSGLHLDVVEVVTVGLGGHDDRTIQTGEGLRRLDLARQELQQLADEVANFTLLHEAGAYHRLEHQHEQKHHRAEAQDDDAKPPNAGRVANRHVLVVEQQPAGQHDEDADPAHHDDRAEQFVTLLVEVHLTLL